MYQTELQILAVLVLVIARMVASTESVSLVCSGRPVATAAVAAEVAIVGLVPLGCLSRGPTFKVVTEQGLSEGSK